jgi:two-component system phosphate regulon response regulator PhoB
MKTIVVADDEDFLRLLVKETLRQYRVIEARDGDEALVLAREAAPDLLILDWMMPGRHGPAVLAELRADPATRDLPVLMMTARAGAAERAQLLAAGATGCMAKPFGTAALRSAVEEILGKPVA